MARDGVQCWGRYSDGVPGFTFRTLDVPRTPLPSGSGVSAISSGELHTCAVMAGGVKCWGLNTNGQLGDGSKTDSALPVTAIDAGSGVTAVATAYDLTCALRGDSVWCWGETSPGEMKSLIPIPVPLLSSGVTSLKSSRGGICVVVFGTHKCWSYLTNFLSEGKNSTPIEVFPSEAKPTQIALSGGTACAVISGGVVCRGGGYYGQLGDPNFDGLRKTIIALRPSTATGTLATSTDVTTSATTVRASELVVLSAAISGTAAVTGTVHFKTDSLTVTGCSAVSIVDMKAKCDARFYTTGAKLITAEYSGSDTHLPSIGTLSNPQTVLKGGQKIEIFPIPDMRFDTSSYSIAPSAVSSSKLAVTLVSITPNICSSEPTDTRVFRFQAEGTCTLRATQSGNEHFFPAPVVEKSFNVVVPRAQSITTLTAPIDVPSGGPPIQITAIASSGLPVTIVSDTPAVCTVTGTLLRLIAIGSCTLRAFQLGNLAYYTAPPVTWTFALTRESVGVVLSVEPASIFYGDIVTLRARVTGDIPQGHSQFCQHNRQQHHSRLCYAAPSPANCDLCCPKPPPNRR